MEWWARFHRRRWYIRWPVKWAAVLFTLFVVSFPYPRLFVRHVEHLLDPNALIDPDAPALAAMVSALQPQLAGVDGGPATFRVIERFVNERIEYAFDWETWGVADYLPEVTEVISAGREDCDGRAVLAASLLRRFGYEANLVTDGAHVWVRTPQGETMGPNEVATLQATAEGVEVNLEGLRILPKTLAFGVSVFPLRREVIVALALWLVLMRPMITASRAAFSAVLIVAALWFVRYGGRSWADPAYWALAFGCLAFACGIAITVPRSIRSAGAPDPQCS